MFSKFFISKVASAFNLDGPSVRFAQTATQLADPKRHPPIVPNFTKGEDVIDPARYTIDCRKYDMSESPKQIPELRQEILAKFTEVGIVHLKNTDLGDDLIQMSQWAKVPMGNVMKYVGGANYRKEISKDIYNVGSPKSAYIHYHHEMAYVGQSVSMLAFCVTSALKPSPDDPYRGATFFSDNLKATDDILKTNFGRKMKNLGVCYIRCLTDREEKSLNNVYNYWQTSFMTDSPEEAERLATQKGLKYAWGPGRYFRTKGYLPAFEYFAPLDRNLLYGSISHHSSKFDSWEGMKDVPDLPDFDSATPEHRAVKMLFGDDSEMSQEELELYSEVYERNAFPLVWEKGDVGIFCNYRFAHGRASIDEKDGESREVGVVLGPRFDRVGQLEGKW